MKELTSTSFGYLIAFLLPGILGLYGLSAWFPQVGAILQPLSKADATVGPSIVFLLVSVGMGLCVSSGRYFLIEKLLYRKRCLSQDIYPRLTADKLAVLKSFSEEHYRYHQFYGGCAISLLILFAGWMKQHYLDGVGTVVAVALGFCIMEILLERSASDCFGKYVDKCNRLIQLEEKK